MWHVKIQYLYWLFGLGWGFCGVWDGGKGKWTVEDRNKWPKNSKHSGIVQGNKWPKSLSSAE